MNTFISESDTKPSSEWKMICQYDTQEEILPKFKSIH